jgi:hypothetical protein
MSVTLLVARPPARASVVQRTATVSRRVDEVMSSLGSEVARIQRDTHLARTTYANTRRATHNVDFGLLGDELDATIGLIAEDLAAASR